jgi:hypothetical protein
MFCVGRRAGLRVHVSDLLGGVGMVRVQRNAKRGTTSRHTGEHIIGKALIESPRIVTALVADVKFTGPTASSQQAAKLRKRFDCIKEPNDVRL